MAVPDRIVIIALRAVFCRVEVHMSRTVYLETMGCQMNVLDSELVMGQLRKLGYVSTPVKSAVRLTCSPPTRATQMSQFSDSASSCPLSRAV